MNVSWSRQVTESFLPAIVAGLEAMAGVAPSATLVEPPGAPEASLPWKQYEAAPFSETSLWCAADTGFQARVGALIGESVGLPDPDRETALAFWAESWAQVLGSVTASLSSTYGMEVKLNERGQGAAPSGPLVEVLVRFPSGVSGSVWLSSQGSAALGQAASPAMERQETAGMRLLANVELPVTVSFGKAFLSVKDVVKLNTGSIIELNRSISEPVEVRVNNAMIARGEVVVVDGNYGIRVLEVRRPAPDGLQL